MVHGLPSRPCEQQLCTAPSRPSMSWVGNCHNGGPSDSVEVRVTGRFARRTSTRVPRTFMSAGTRATQNGPTIDPVARPGRPTTSGANSRLEASRAAGNPGYVAAQVRDDAPPDNSGRSGNSPGDSPQPDDAGRKQLASSSARGFRLPLQCGPQRPYRSLLPVSGEGERFLRTHPPSAVADGLPAETVGWLILWQNLSAGHRTSPRLISSPWQARGLG